MIKEIAVMHIENEISLAKRALVEENTGKARVCARRAAGIAISYWLESHPEINWGESAISLLNNLKVNKLMPDKIREAAVRLTTSVKNKSSKEFTEDPLQDSGIIIKYFIKNYTSK